MGERRGPHAVHSVIQSSIFVIVRLLLFEEIVLQFQYTEAGRTSRQERAVRSLVGVLISTVDTLGGWLEAYVSIFRREDLRLVGRVHFVSRRLVITVYRGNIR